MAKKLTDKKLGAAINYLDKIVENGTGDLPSEDVAKFRTELISSLANLDNLERKIEKLNNELAQKQGLLGEIDTSLATYGLRDADARVKEDKINEAKAKLAAYDAMSEDVKKLQNDLDESIAIANSYNDFYDALAAGRCFILKEEGKEPITLTVENKEEFLKKLVEAPRAKFDIDVEKLHKFVNVQGWTRDNEGNMKPENVELSQKGVEGAVRAAYNNAYNEGYHEGYNSRRTYGGLAATLGVTTGIFAIASIIGFGSCLGASCGSNKGNDVGITESQLEAVLNSSTFLDRVLNGEEVSQEEVDAFKAQLENLKNSGNEALQNYATQQEKLYNALLNFANSGSNEAKMEAYKQLLGALYNAKNQYNVALQDGSLTEEEKKQVMQELQNIDQLEAQLNSALGAENYYGGMFDFYSDLLSAKSSVGNLEDSHSKNYKDVIQAANGVFAAYTENLQDDKLSDAEKTDLVSKLGAIKETEEYKSLSDEEKAQVNSVLAMAESMVSGRMSYEQLNDKLGTIGLLNKIYEDYKAQGADGLDEAEKAALLGALGGVSVENNAEAASVREALNELFSMDRNVKDNSDKLETIAAISNVYNDYKAQSADGLSEEEKTALLGALSGVNTNGYAEAESLKEAVDALINGKAGIDAMEANKKVIEAYNSLAASMKDLNEKFDLAVEDGNLSEEEKQAIQSAVDGVRTSADYTTLNGYNKDGSEAILDTFVKRVNEYFNMQVAASQLSDLMKQYGVNDAEELAAKLLNMAEQAGYFNDIFETVFGQKPEDMPEEEFKSLLESLGVGSGSVHQPTPGNPNDEMQPNF